MYMIGLEDARALSCGTWRKAMAQKPQTSFEIDDKTANALETLKSVYGVSSNAAVLKRALAIALVASKQADPDHNIHFLRKAEDGEETEVVLPQRY
jgi:hypothetical protein